MTLTLGSGPFGHNPAGTFNRPMPDFKGLIYLETSPRRIRGRLGAETVVDSLQPKLLHEHGQLPVLYFPPADVRTDLLEPTDHRTHCPWKGDASYWTLRVGEREAENQVWSYREPLAGVAGIAGHYAFYMTAMDEWLEEDEPMLGHARDPYHAIDVLDTSRHVRVSLHGEALGESRRARVLFESGLPPRWYLPAEDVRAELLEPSETTSRCSYKGFARYRSARVGGELEEDVAWIYDDPRPAAARVAGYVCFWNERVDLEVDGKREERPQTPFSEGAPPVYAGLVP
jgi:uncharacterized protein (DUF427 family)